VDGDDLRRVSRGNQQGMSRMDDIDTIGQE
jgi:hypothetical protein